MYLTLSVVLGVKLKQLMCFQFPRTEQVLKDIAIIFESRFNFPHYLSAIDGKHVDFVPPGGPGLAYFNYKKRHSMVLLAIVNAKYQFIMCDLGTNGRVSDGEALLNTKFFENLSTNF